MVRWGTKVRLIRTEQRQRSASGFETVHVTAVGVGIRWGGPGWEPGPGGEELLEGVEDVDAVFLHGMGVRADGHERCEVVVVTDMPETLSCYAGARIPRPMPVARFWLAGVSGLVLVLVGAGGFGGTIALVDRGWLCPGCARFRGGRS